MHILENHNYAKNLNKLFSKMIKKRKKDKYLPIKDYITLVKLRNKTMNFSKSKIMDNPYLR